MKLPKTRRVISPIKAIFNEYFALYGGFYNFCPSTNRKE